VEPPRCVGAPAVLLPFFAPKNSLARRQVHPPNELTSVFLYRCEFLRMPFRRISEKSCTAKFAEFPFHALR
jgi:hypothetical protein